MKKVAIALVGFVLIFGIFIGCKKSTGPEEEKTLWTIVAYMDGNNNLDISLNGNSYTIADAQNLELVGSTDKVKIIAAIGSIKTGGIVKYYYIEHHTDELPDSLSSRVLRNEGTKDMSDPQTLKDFLAFVKNNYPAEHYLLIIDDHGGGWRGACVDNQNGSGNMMTLTQMKSAIEEFGKFDIIVFHACLMSQVEVVYELKDVCDYVLGSEFTLPMESILGADEWLRTLVDNPSISPEELSGSIVDAVYNAAVRKGKKTHFAAIKTDKIRTLAVRIGNLGNHLVTESGSHWDEVVDAWNNTHYTEYDDPTFIDIREFVNKIKNEPHIGTNPIIKADADSVISAINKAVLRTITNVAGMTRGGLTIYLPSSHDQFDSVNYVQLAFKSTNWYAFISKFIANAVGGGGGEEVRISGTITWTRHRLEGQTYAFLDTSYTSAIVPILITPANADGTYEISFRLTGMLEAIVEAWDDVDGDGDLSVGDGIGWYDHNHDGDWNDMLALTSGTTLTNANIQLTEVTGATIWELASSRKNFITTR